MEINSLNSLAAGKQLSLYFVYRISIVRRHHSHHNRLAQLQALIPPMWWGLCHLDLPAAYTNFLVLWSSGDGHVPLRLTAYLRMACDAMPNVVAVRGRIEEMMWLLRRAETALLGRSCCDQS